MSETETTGFFGPLDLGDADLKGFDAIPAGRYNAEIFAISMDSVKNQSGQGKMPAGTPMMKVQFKITDPEYDNRRVWSQYVIPPNDYDQAKASKMKGMLARFFIALGVPEETVLSNAFQPDFDDFLGKPCVVTVAKQPKRTMEGEIIPEEFNNPVTGVKPAGSLAGSEVEAGSIL